MDAVGAVLTVARLARDDRPVAQWPAGEKYVAPLGSHSKQFRQGSDRLDSSRQSGDDSLRAEPLRRVHRFSRMQTMQAGTHRGRAKRQTTVAYLVGSCRMFRPFQSGHFVAPGVIVGIAVCKPSL